MAEIAVDGGNGNTLAWRLGKLEAEVDRKAGVADLQRLEEAQKILTASINRLIVLAFTATLSGATAAVLLAVQLISTR